MASGVGAGAGNHPVAVMYPRSPPTTGQVFAAVPKCGAVDVDKGAVRTLFHSLPSKTSPASPPTYITITISIGVVQEKRQT